MSRYEEELQKNIEEGQHASEGDELDVKAYQEVFRVLKQQPAFELPAGFADRVLMQVEKKRGEDSLRDMFWLGGGILLISIAFVVTIQFTGFKFTAGFLSEMADYKWLFVCGVGFIALLNWLDKRLIRDKHINI